MASEGASLRVLLRKRSAGIRRESGLYCVLRPSRLPEVSMPRTFRLAVLLGLFVLAGLGFPSLADAQRRGGSGGGGGARGAASVRTGGAAVHGGGIYGGSRVAVSRTYRPYSSYRPYYSHPYYSRPYYSHPYYSHPYYSHPYYSGYYPHYYSPWSFSLSFGFGWYGG